LINAKARRPIESRFLIANFSPQLSHGGIKESWRIRMTKEGYEKPPTRKIILGGSPTSSQKRTILWKPVLKTANFEQLCHTFAENRFY